MGRASKEKQRGCNIDKTNIKTEIKHLNDICNSILVCTINRFLCGGQSSDCLPHRNGIKKYDKTRLA